jgi:hypothetical protein
MIHPLQVFHVKVLSTGKINAGAVGRPLDNDLVYDRLLDVGFWHDPYLRSSLRKPYSKLYRNQHLSEQHSNVFSKY